MSWTSMVDVPVQMMDQQLKLHEADGLKTHKSPQSFRLLVSDGSSIESLTKEKDPCVLLNK